MTTVKVESKWTTTKRVRKPVEGNGLFVVRYVETENESVSEPILRLFVANNVYLLDDNGRLLFTGLREAYCVTDDTHTVNISFE